jgi:hypothetical protein
MQTTDEWRAYATVKLVGWEALIDTRRTWRMRLGDVWCSFAHDSPMWPIHGQYECRLCGRRYSVPWAKRSEIHEHAGVLAVVDSMQSRSAFRQAKRPEISRSFAPRTITQIGRWLREPTAMTVSFDKPSLRDSTRETLRRVRVEKRPGNSQSDGSAGTNSQEDVSQAEACA